MHLGRFLIFTILVASALFITLSTLKKSKVTETVTEEVIISESKIEPKVIEKSLNESPTVLLFKKMQGEEPPSEHPSSNLLQKSRAFAKYVKKVDQNPAIQPQALPHFEKCAKSDNVPEPIRARCLTHLRQYAEKFNKPFDEKEYPKRIVRLSNSIH